MGSVDSDLMTLMILLDVLVVLSALLLGRLLAHSVYHRFERFPAFSSPEKACLNYALIALTTLFSLWFRGSSLPIFSPILHGEPASPFALFLLALIVFLLTAELTAQRLQAQGLAKAPPDYEAPWLEAERRRMAEWRRIKKAEHPDESSSRQ